MPNADYDAPRDRYQVVLDALRTEHQAQIWSSAMQWGWSCSCGKGGSCTTNGRAAAARDKHLNAERKRIHERVFPPGNSDSHEWLGMDR